MLLRIAVAPDAEDQRRHLAEIDLILQIKAGLFQDLGVEEVEDGVGRIAIDGVINVDRSGILDERLTGHLLEIGIVDARSEEHTSELQSLMRISYAVYSLK